MCKYRDLPFNKFSNPGIRKPEDSCPLFSQVSAIRHPQNLIMLPTKNCVYASEEMLSEFFCLRQAVNINTRKRANSCLEVHCCSPVNQMRTLHKAGKSNDKHRHSFDRPNGCDQVE